MTADEEKRTAEADSKSDVGVSAGTLESLEEGRRHENVVDEKTAADEDPDGDAPVKHTQEPTRKKENKNAPTVSLFRMFAMADKYDVVLMTCGTIGALIHGASFPAFCYFFGKLIDGIGHGHNPSATANKYALALVNVGIVTLFSSWAEVALWMQSGDRQASKLRTKYLEALLRQDVTYFDLHTGTGDFVSSVASHPIMVQSAISEKAGHTLHYLGRFVSGFAVGFYGEWRIALVTIAVVPMIAVGGGFYAFALSLATAKASTSYSEAEVISEQAISQVRTVYSFVAEARFVKAYSDALQTTLKLGARGGLAKGLGIGTTFCTLSLSWALLLWYGGLIVRQGITNGGTALTTIFAMTIASMSLGQAMPDFAAFARGRAAAYKIFRLIDHEPTISKPDGKAKTLECVEGLIELREVNFFYPSRPKVQVFKNFSLEIPPGKVVAIVGSSGIGKSSVISLIGRFYDPTAGAVLLDGHDLKTLNLKWLRNQIGLVNQEPALFATTIAENILYGKDGASQKEIEEVAKAANAHSFIERLPMKYQTQVGESGVQLSGGQKQRVAIARALLTNPKVMLLDEATSALDAESERTVQEALERLMVGRTTVVVAHRLSTIQMPTRLLWFRVGKP